MRGHFPIAHPTDTPDIILLRLLPFSASVIQNQISKDLHPIRVKINQQNLPPTNFLATPPFYKVTDAFTAIAS